MKLCPGVNKEGAQSLWGRIKGQATVSDTVVGICYRSRYQKEEVDEAFFRQLELGSQSQALVFIMDINHPDICWKDHIARHKQSRKFLRCIDDNF